MTNNYERIEITEAREGDEVLQAGEWVKLAAAHVFRNGQEVKLMWAGGGSHTRPVSHGGAVRRLVVNQAEAMARATGSVAATVRVELRNQDGTLTTVSEDTYTRPPALEVQCQECEEWHPAEYSHEGRFGEGPIYAVVCGEFTDYYTDELVRPVRA